MVLRPVSKYALFIFTKTELLICTSQGELGAVAFRTTVSCMRRRPSVRTDGAAVAADQHFAISKFANAIDYIDAQNKPTRLHVSARTGAQVSLGRLGCTPRHRVDRAPRDRTTSGAPLTQSGVALLCSTIARGSGLLQCRLRPGSFYGFHRRCRTPLPSRGAACGG